MSTVATVRAEVVCITGAGRVGRVPPGTYEVVDGLDGARPGEVFIDAGDHLISIGRERGLVRVNPNDANITYTNDEPAAIGTCEGCNQSIFETDQWENDDEPVPGMWHPECLDA